MVRFTADAGLKVAVGVFFISAFLLAATYDATFAFDRPVSTIVLTCFLTGTVLLIIARFFSLVTAISSPTAKRSRAPLADQYELASPSSSRSSSPTLSSFSSPILDERTPPIWSGYWYKIGLLLSICFVRLEFFRRVSHNSECVPAGFSYIIPLLVSIYDFWCDKRLQAKQEYVYSNRFQSKPIQAAYATCRRCLHSLTQSGARGIIAASLISLGGYSGASFLSGSQSTYICPIISKTGSHIRIIKIASAIIDSLILIGVANLSGYGTEKAELRRKRTLVSLGGGLLLIALIWGITGHFIYKNRPEHSQPLDARYIRGAFGQALLVILLIISAWQMMPSFGILGISIIGGFIFLYFPAAATLFFRQTPFPFISLSHAVFPFIASTTGVGLFVMSRLFLNEESKSLYRMHVTLQVIFIILGCVALIFASNKHQFSHTHPIDILVQKATMEFDSYAEQAGASTSLKAAAAEYRSRYHQHPPPGFDKWYEYAINRSSVIIDDFDDLHKNLLPFRSVPPNELRAITQKLATNPFNDLGAISIRDGRPRVQEGIKPTHAWMVKAAAEMIEKFSENLPDMDLVFNLNDEPRVAVPWEKIWPYKRAAKKMEYHFDPHSKIMNTWSANRGDGWGPIEPADLTHETVFTDGSSRAIFDPYISTICPPSSPARTHRVWNRRDICLSCTHPHSMGQFPKSFDLASDICHQPDLAFLHGLLLSPASFKVSQELIPIFSQSAVKGFSDILFPSPWNYIDKVKYDPSPAHPDPSFDTKENSIYWAGSTSEGFSHHGEWKGMPRQRFVHLVNNNTDNQVSVLLPHGPHFYKYEIMNGNDPIEKLDLRANVHLVNPITRCDDCDEQKDEMGTVSWVDFQDHWSHRFLFDLDGAGFSGRFLPFLQSHSLPFKTGLFRQWYDSRIISWFHFVPVDIRLHGFWSTLAYFAGVSDPNINENEPQQDSSRGITRMDAHFEQGRWIGEQGRKWTEIALRKEDMEIYFFRLLLEWARLTDDQRESLGFMT
ncbi:hypothetical protein N7540_001652 [Penicillium herquei]|nr:hypothetical protein N7540_001652 [Penicillium herquei]